MPNPVPPRAVSRRTLEREMLHALDLSPTVQYPVGCVVPSGSSYTEYVATLEQIAQWIQHAKEFGFVSAEHERHLERNTTSGSCHDCAMEFDPDA